MDIGTNSKTICAILCRYRPLVPVLESGDDLLYVEEIYVSRELVMLLLCRVSDI